MLLPQRGVADRLMMRPGRPRQLHATPHHPTTRLNAGKRKGINRREIVRYKQVNRRKNRHTDSQPDREINLLRKKTTQESMNRSKLVPWQSIYFFH